MWEFHRSPETGNWHYVVPWPRPCFCRFFPTSYPYSLQDSMPYFCFKELISPTDALLIGPLQVLHPFLPGQVFFFFWLTGACMGCFAPTLLVIIWRPLWFATENIQEYPTALHLLVFHSYLHISFIETQPELSYFTDFFF